MIVNIEGHLDAQDLGPSECLRAMLPVELCSSEWPKLSPGAMVTFRPGCHSQWPCLSLWYYFSQGLCCHQRLYRSLGSGLQLVTLLVSGTLLLPEPSWYEWPVLSPRGSQDVIKAQSSAEGCLGLRSCCSWGFYWNLWPISPQGVVVTMHDEIRGPYSAGQPFTGPGTADPALCWTL